MTESQRGNLLEADVEALVNTVNCVGIMGKGIALQFKQAFPDNFREYARACRAGQVHLGQMLVVPTGGLTNPRYIINFPTKRHWRGKSHLTDIESGLAALVAEVRRLDIHSIAVPPLGCGNGGLDWAEVRPLIEAAFADLPDVRVLIYEPEGAPAAEAMPVATKRPRLTRARALLIRLMELYRIPGYRLSLLEIQKLAYFLQAAGEPLKLNYTANKYGPYAENLNFVLQKLEGHYIRGYGDRSREAEVYLLPDAVDEARAVLAEAPDAAARLAQVSRLIEGFETPYGMELLATVHWVGQEDPQAATDVATAITRVQSWNPRKRLVFQPHHIETTWQRLQDEHWLAATP